ncbi:MAG TPA: DMT family transporter [Ardenticatenaceae bacterium]|jgi:drug/metabolite transporter (DMT)-like permease
MPNNNPSHLRAVVQALFVTLLWSTSWIFIKIGLEGIPALTFAGLRYSLAFLVLLPFLFRAEHLASLRQLSRRMWMQLLVLGVLFYAVTQGAQFLGLAYLPSVTVSLLLNFTAVVVAMLGIVFLGERPSSMQWLGVALSIVGTIIYFYPVSLPASQLVGLVIVVVGVIANAISAVMGRSINRTGDISPLVVTVVSMGVGSFLLLVSGLATQGLPPLSLGEWANVAWLAVASTAVAFTLWNHTLRVLSAVESSVINNTMLIQIAVLAWLFLGERLTAQQIVGMLVAGTGALVVQLRRGASGEEAEQGVVQSDEVIKPAVAGEG